MTTAGGPPGLPPRVTHATAGPRPAALTDSLLRERRQRLLDGGHHAVQLLVADDQRRLDAQHVAEVAAHADEHVVLEAVLARERRRLGAVGLGRLVLDQLDADHEAAAAHVADQRLGLLQLAEAPP